MLYGVYTYTLLFHVKVFYHVYFSHHKNGDCVKNSNKVPPSKKALNELHFEEYLQGDPKWFDNYDKYQRGSWGYLLLLIFNIEIRMKHVIKKIGLIYAKYNISIICYCVFKTDLGLDWYIYHQRCEYRDVIADHYRKDATSILSIQNILSIN